MAPEKKNANCVQGRTWPTPVASICEELQRSLPPVFSLAACDDHDGRDGDGQRFYINDSEL